MTDVWIIQRGSGQWEEYRSEIIAVYDSAEAAEAHAKAAAAWHNVEIVEPCGNIVWELTDEALEESDRLRKRAATNPFDRDFDDTERRTYWHLKMEVRQSLPKSRLKRYLTSIPA